MRDEKGLLVYDDEFRRRFMTPKKIALCDEFVRKTGILIEQYERGEISKQEYDSLVEELEAERIAACERLYDEEFSKRSADTEEKNFFAPSNFSTA